MPPPTIATRARCSPLTPPGRAPSRHPVQREVEGVEVADTRAGVEPGAAIRQDRHALLGGPPLRARRRAEAGGAVRGGRVAAAGWRLATPTTVAVRYPGRLKPRQ